MPAVFRTKRRIEFADTDMAGMVHFANFFRFMEAAEVAFLRSLGLSVALVWEGQAIGFPRVAASCDYLQPIRFEDEVDITVEVARVGSKSVTYRFGFEHQGQAVARGQITAVCCRAYREPHALESVEIPAGIRARLLGEEAAGPASGGAYAEG
jgi:YbgC/YbaW family acyl-CoA thioester hydrolase